MDICVQLNNGEIKNAKSKQNNKILIKSNDCIPLRFLEMSMGVSEARQSEHYIWHLSTYVHMLQ